MRSRCRAGSPRPSRESWGMRGLSTGAETQARCELWGQFLPVCNCFSNVSGQEAGLLSVWKEAEIVQTVDGTFVLFSMDSVMWAFVSDFLPTVQCPIRNGHMNEGHILCWEGVTKCWKSISCDTLPNNLQHREAIVYRLYHDTVWCLFIAWNKQISLKWYSLGWPLVLIKESHIPASLGDIIVIHFVHV